MRMRTSLLLLAAGLAAAWAPPAGAQADQSLKELSQQARAHRNASTLKVWYNEDIEALRTRTTISVVGQEPPPPPAPKAEAGRPAPARLEPSDPDAGMSMEERQARIASLEQQLAENEATLNQLREQLAQAQTDAEREIFDNTIRGWEAAGAQLRAEIEKLKSLPPPSPPPAAPPQ